MTGRWTTDQPWGLEIRPAPGGAGRLGELALRPGDMDSCCRGFILKSEADQLLWSALQVTCQNWSNPWWVASGIGLLRVWANSVDVRAAAFTRERARLQSDNRACMVQANQKYPPRLTPRTLEGKQAPRRVVGLGSRTPIGPLRCCDVTQSPGTNGMLSTNFFGPCGGIGSH